MCFTKLFDLRPPYIYFYFFGTLGCLFLVWFLVFENFEISFWIRISTFGGSVLKTFWFQASLHMFLIFWKFRGSFWVWFLILKFQNCILNQKSYFWGGLFYKTFWFEASLYMFLIFRTLGGLFWVWFLVFENFEIVFWFRIPTFGRSVLKNVLIWGLLIYVFDILEI